MYSASDDLPTPEKLRLLLKDIREARQSKIRSGLSAVNSVHLGVSSPFLSSSLSSPLSPSSHPDGSIRVHTS